MKKILQIIAILMVSFTFNCVRAQYPYTPTFSAVSPSGHTLYYDTIGNDAILMAENNMFSYPRPATAYTTMQGHLAIPDSVTFDNITYPVSRIGQSAFENCGSLLSVTLPSNLKMIYWNAFLRCDSLSSVTLPNSVVAIGGQAFWECSKLDNVVLPDSLTYLGRGAFAFCEQLRSINIPSKIDFIDELSFAYCRNLSSISIHPSASIDSICRRAFYECDSLQSFTLPESLKYIGEEAFYGCEKLCSLTFPDSLREIGPWAFAGCSGLNNITIPSALSIIDTGVFAGCTNFTQIVIPSNITQVKSSAFSNCANTDTIILGDSITYIGDYAFSGCSNIISIIIPEFVSYIGKRAFKSCDALNNVTFVASVPPHLGVRDGGALIQFWQRELPWDTLAVTINIPCGAYYSYLYQQRGYPYFDAILSEEWQKYRIVEPDPGVVLTLGINDTLKGSVSIIRRANSSRDVFCRDSSVIIFAEPNYGYHFDHWSNGSTGIRDTLYLTSDSIVTAIFSPNQYTVTAISTDTTLGIVTGSGNYDYGTNISLWANVIAEHYHFDKWSNGSTDNPLTITIESDSILTAEFAIDTHSVSDVANDAARGSVITSGTTFAYGQTCTIEATAYSGYVFAGWGNGVTYNPYTFIVQNDVELTANFIAEDEQMHTITVVSADERMGTATGGGTYVVGQEVVLTAMANAGYVFDHWQDGDTTNPRTITVIADATYVANFVAETQGIEEASETDIRVWSKWLHINIIGCDGCETQIFDMVGRKVDGGRKIYFDVPSAGVYLVKIGNLPARKVVVIR